MTTRAPVLQCPAVFRFAGQMIDAPVLAHAAEILRQAEALPGTAAGPAHRAPDGGVQ